MRNKVDYGRWSYGTAGDRHQVVPGDRWVVGRHRFACADLEALNAPVWRDAPDVVYTDPPWDPARATAFRTKARVPRRVDFYGALIPAVVRQIPIETRGSVFCEMGRREASQVAAIFDASGFKLLTSWSITYARGKSPCVLMRFGPEGRDDGFDADLSGRDDRHTPMLVLREYPAGRLVLDPCMGLGRTPIAAVKCGHRFMGSELHPRRIAESMEQVSRIVGEKPCRIR